MIRLEEIQRGLTLVGLEPTALCSVITVVPIAEGTIQVIYKTPDGTIKDRILNRADESSLSVATTERPWSFDGEGDAFKLAVEAKRIDLAFLFDPMMAVHTSNVDPLPHQITAVYGRTAAQLQTIFDKLPEATFCFDIGHARQVDPTMQEAESFLRLFQDRIRQVHMSYVNSQSRHERLNFESIQAFQRVAHRLNPSVPVILETPVQSGEIDDEISAAEQVFAFAAGFVRERKS